MSSDNPYASPATQDVDEIRPAVVSESLGSIARTTFLAWEKLRLIYITILGLETILLGMVGALQQLGLVRFGMIVLPGAIVANLCFFVGPIVDTYVSWLGYRSTWLRLTLFVLGTLFACVLALGVFAGVMLPAID